MEPIKHDDTFLKSCQPIEEFFEKNPRYKKGLDKEASKLKAAFKLNIEALKSYKNNEISRSTLEKMHAIIEKFEAFYERFPQDLSDALFYLSNRIGKFPPKSSKKIEQMPSPIQTPSPTSSETASPISLSPKPIHSKAFQEAEKLIVSLSNLESIDFTNPRSLPLTTLCQNAMEVICNLTEEEQYALLQAYPKDLPYIFQHALKGFLHSRTILQIPSRTESITYENYIKFSRTILTNHPYSAEALSAITSFIEYSYNKKVAKQSEETALRTINLANDPWYKRILQALQKIIASFKPLAKSDLSQESKQLFVRQLDKVMLELKQLELNPGLPSTITLQQSLIKEIVSLLNQLQ